MPIKSYSIDEIHERMVGKMTSQIGDVRVKLATHPLNVLALSASGAIASLYDALDDAVKGSFALSASASDLDRLGKFWNVTRGPASHAVGRINFQSSSALIIAKGTRLSSHDGTLFETLAEFQIAENSEAEIAVQAVEAGISGNLKAGQEVSWIKPILGAPQIATVFEGGVIGGNDRENDYLYRNRILLSLRNPNKNGSISDYENWALARGQHEVPVSRAFVQMGEEGAGTVDIYILLESDNNLLALPNTEQMDKVKAFIDIKRPIGTKITIKEPKLEDANIEISNLKINSEAPRTKVQEAIRYALSSYFMRVASPGNSIALNNLYETIGNVSHVDDFTLAAPQGNITPADNTTILKPNISFSK